MAKKTNKKLQRGKKLKKVKSLIVVRKNGGDPTPC
jgi:hypothetical protein